MKMRQIEVLILLTLVLLAGRAMSQQASSRTVTNADLEKYRAERVRADEDYLKKYKQQGLPSPEEIERRNDDNIRRVSEYSTELGIQRRSNAILYREQANVIASQISAIDGQIAYLSSIAQSPAYRGAQLSVYSPGYSWPAGNYGPYLRPQAPQGQPGTVIGPNVAAVQQQASMFPNAASIRAQGGGNFSGPGAYGRNYRGGYGGSGNFYAPSVVTGNNFSQSEISSRLTYLYQLRAGLAAQWHSLNDQARRAGVNIY